MFALTLLFPLSVEAQLRSVVACPNVIVNGGEDAGSGAVVAVREGWGYVLTAAHVVPRNGLDLRFYSRGSYPKPAWRTLDAEVCKRWSPDLDLALLKFPVGPHAVPTLPLAPPGRRPKLFPAAVAAVGCDGVGPPTLEADAALAKRLVRPLEEPVRVAFFWETARPSRPGRSGGPLLDLDGRVIGICSANQSGKAYYVHLDEIQAALKREGYSWIYALRSP